ncbi:MAG TPA: class I SAM-dependent methyltransferase, partial [Chloroflexota bacterium]
MALLPKGFTKGLLLGGLAALVWGVLGNRRRRATVAGPIVERAESLPFLGPRLYGFFAGTMMADLYTAVAKDVLAEIESGDVLEVGAGVGYLAVELAERNRNIQMTAMNREAGMSYATESRVHAAGLGRQVKVSRGDATDIPYPNEYFDA